MRSGIGNIVNFNFVIWGINGIECIVIVGESYWVNMVGFKGDEVIGGWFIGWGIGEFEF